MENTNKSDIANKGFVRVNLPVIIIIFGSWFILMYSNYFSFKECAIISGVFGWIYWEFAIVKWIRWSLSQGIDKTELYKIGKRNLLVWSEYKIEKVSKKMNQSK